MKASKVQTPWDSDPEPRICIAPIGTKAAAAGACTILTGLHGSAHVGM